MTIVIIEAVSKMFFAIDNLVVVFGLATLTLTINNFALLLEVTNMLPPPNFLSYIYHLLQFKKVQTKRQALLNFGNEIYS